ncbi:MAG: class I SAM-dependent methyltransferase, partial [Methanothrix sp.]
VEERTFRRGRGILTHYFTEEEVIGLFGGLRPVSVGIDVRTTRIRGRDHLRSEVTAVFVR